MINHLGNENLTDISTVCGRSKSGGIIQLVGMQLQYMSTAVVDRIYVPSHPAGHLSGVKSPHAVYTLSFHTSAPSSSKQDFYQILGVPRTATQKEIKKAYYQVRY